MSDPTSRALELLSLLENHRYWTGTRLAEHLGVTTRTLRRDIDRLRELGYDIAATHGPAGGYHLESGGALPPLLLEDDEAIAIAVGLRSTAAGALTGSEEVSLRVLTKLEQMMPARLRHRVAALQSETMHAPSWETTPVDPDVLSRLAVYCREHERIRFDYTNYEGVASRRHVEPHRLMSTERRWYLVCWDLLRRDWRTFRVDRIGELITTHERFTPRHLSEETLADMVTVAHYWSPTKLTAWIHMDASMAEVQEAFGPWAAGAEEVDATHTRWPIGGETVEQMAIGLVWMRFSYRVEGPPEFLEYLEGYAERMRAALPRSTAVASASSTSNG